MKHILISCLKFLTESQSQKNPNRDQTKDWCKDPLAHPEISVMSERERADLQFDRGKIKCG